MARRLLGDYVTRDVSSVTRTRATLGGNIWPRKNGSQPSLLATPLPYMRMPNTQTKTTRCSKRHLRKQGKPFFTENQCRFHLRTRRDYFRQKRARSFSSKVYRHLKSVSEQYPPTACSDASDNSVRAGGCTARLNRVPNR